MNNNNILAFSAIFIALFSLISPHALAQNKKQPVKHNTTAQSSDAEDDKAPTPKADLFWNDPIVGKGIVNFTVEVKNYARKPVVLGYYFNNKMLVKDTVLTDDRCVAHFQRDTLYEQGLYILHFPENGAVFDILMPEEQKFALKCDTMARQADRASVKNSRPIANFLEYQRYISAKQLEFSDIMKEFQAPNTTPERKEEIRKRYIEVDSLVKAHNEEVIAANKDNFLSNFLRALKEVKIPTFDIPEGLTKHERDSIQQMRGYYYYRAHFYDNFDMNDDRLLRTPFFLAKINRYFEETVPQVPDTVAAEAIRLIEMCRGNKEMFRFFVSTMYNLVNQSKIMGMDAALVKLADKYYLAGQTPWNDQKFLDELRENVDGIRYTLVGLQAPDLKMPSVTGEWYRLSDVKAKFTVLVFWEPSCGHCKKEVPHIKTALYDKYAAKGLKVFAVYCQVDEQPWKEFIEEHQLEEFINVYDPYGRSGFRKFYHIKSTPTIFLLDENKKIIAKKLGVDQLDEFIAHELAEQNK
ncbi:MAG: redoxin domain-containing protein [Marinilabiliaceae bacterium]